MKDQCKTKQVLIQELTSLRQRITELEQSESDSKQTEVALRESEERRMRSIFRAAPIGIGVVTDRILNDVNLRICEMTGYTKEELIGASARILYPTQDDFDYVGTEKYRQIAQTGTGFVETRWKKMDGTIINVLLSSTPIDLSDLSRGVTFTALDITERKRAEEALHQSEEKYRTILEEIQEGYFEVDLAGNLTFFNDSLCRFFDASKEELMGMNYRQYTTDKGHSKELFKAFNKVYNTGEPTEGFDWQIIRKDGTKRYVEASISLRKDSSDKPIGFRGIARDVTEQRKSEELYRLLADNMTEHVWLMDLNTIKMTYVSPSVEKIYGYTSDEILKLPFKKFLTAESFLKVKDLLSNDIPKILSNPLSSVHKYSLELEVCHKDGHLLWIEDNLSFLRDENGKPSFLLGETRDITERKRAEDKLKETLENLRKSIKTTIQVLGTASEARDPYTAGHQRKVADLASAIATEMGLSHEKIEGILMASSIHDIGKISIPAEILSKPTKLTEIEFSLIKEHSQSGYDMMKDMESPWPLAQIISQHHERMNGSGYPRNLKGDEIIMESRILAVADVVEAMASHRPYRPTLGIEAALEEIEKNKGILYDDAVVDSCLRLFRKKGYQFP